MRYKVIIIIGSLTVGGAEKHILQIIPKLDRKQFLIQVFTLTHRGSLAPILEQSGIPVVSPRQFRYIFGKLAIGLQILCSTWGLYRAMRREEPDIVHFFLPASYIIGGICALLARCPKRIMSRRSMNNYQKKYLFLSCLERFLHRTMTQVVGNSKAVLHQLSDEGVPSSKLRLIYNGMSINHLAHTKAEIRQTLIINEHAVVLVIVANLIPYKGHMDLLKALASVNDEMPDDWLLLCVGRDTGILDKLESVAKELNITEHVRFLGERSDVPYILTASDIGIICSHEEGFSNSILEGMFIGLPMIVTDVGGNSEAVVDGLTGIIVPPREPLALGTAIVKLASDNELRHKMGKMSKIRVEETFSTEQCVNSYEALYQEIIST